MKPIKLNVTAGHIKIGKPKSRYQCPITAAIAERFPQLEHLSVTRTHIEYTYQGKRKTRLLPLEAVNFTIDFDGGHPVEPFRFDLNDPLR